MPIAKDILGTVFEKSSSQMLARIVDTSGVPIPISSISTVEYTIREADPCRMDQWTVVPGHDTVPLSANAVLFDMLQLGDPWDIDSIGYNFRHDLNVSAHEAFPNAGRTYQIRYDLQPVAGEVIVVRFQVQAI